MEERLVFPQLGPPGGQYSVKSPVTLAHLEQKASVANRSQVQLPELQDGANIGTLPLSRMPAWIAAIRPTSGSSANNQQLFPLVLQLSLQSSSASSIVSWPCP